jgi:hypothetical protein
MGLTYVADELVQSHGYLDGLKEYIIQHDIDFWHAEPQGRGLFYTHEIQFLYGLQQFLTREKYLNLASRIQRILQCTYEQSGDLWAVVYMILGRIDPPAFDYGLSCEFEPRNDPEARAKRADFATFGYFL